MVNIGEDDYGQQYFLEYVNKEGKLVEVGCGAYNTDYHYVIERLFGTHKQCVTFNASLVCENYLAHGYCSNCPHNQLVIARNERLKAQGLIPDGVDLYDDEQGVNSEGN
jgi:hypothetical protein